MNSLTYTTDSALSYINLNKYEIKAKGVEDREKPLTDQDQTLNYLSQPNEIPSPFISQSSQVRLDTPWADIYVE